MQTVSITVWRQTRGDMQIMTWIIDENTGLINQDYKDGKNDSTKKDTDVGKAVWNNYFSDIFYQFEDSKPSIQY